MNDSTELKRSPLFEGIPAENMPRVLSALGAQTVTIQRGTLLHMPVEPVIVLLLSGCVHVVQASTSGQHTIIKALTPGKMVGELPIPLPGGSHQPELVAHTDCRLLTFPRERLLDAKQPEHERLIGNLISIYSENQRALLQKVQLLSLRRTRDRVLAFLTREAKAQGSRTFAIGFTRQELADYLCVDRSSLCTEIGRMKQEGVLDCRGRTFTLRALPKDMAGEMLPES